MSSNFNTYFKKYYDYNPTEELELLSQVYTYDNTEDLTRIVNRVKNAPFNCKLHINTVKVGAKILLLIEVVHLETIDPGTVKRYVRDIKHNIQSSNIKIVSRTVSDIENIGEHVTPGNLKGGIE